MQELAEEIATQAKYPDPMTLEKAAHLWTAFALQELKGTMLRKALEISAALIDFVDEYEGKRK